MDRNLFLAASYLTDPFCRAGEMWERIRVAQDEDPRGWRVLYVVQMVAWGALAAVTTLPGLVLRAAAVHMQAQPYLYMEGEGEERELPPNRQFSLLSWNVCGVEGGYSILYGGVWPWRYRAEAVTRAIERAGADVVCLQEAFDPVGVYPLAGHLQRMGYRHIYWNMGPRAVGLSSGLLVASKYRIANPAFTPFPSDTLVGQTQGTTKGFFTCQLESRKERFATLIATHPQHSVRPEVATPDEVEARRRQMEMVMERVDQVREGCLAVTGDLNMDTLELRGSEWIHRFQKIDTPPTWRGDAFCSRLQGIDPSGPLTLDHTLVLRGRVAASRLLETGYEPNRYSIDALSDHEGLLCEILV